MHNGIAYVIITATDLTPTVPPGTVAITRNGAHLLPGHWYVARENPKALLHIAYTNDGRSQAAWTMGKRQIRPPSPCHSGSPIVALSSSGRFLACAQGDPKEHLAFLMDLKSDWTRRMDWPIVGDRSDGTFAFSGDQTAAALIEAGPECANDTLATPARVIFYSLSTGRAARGPCADTVMPYGKNSFALVRSTGEHSQKFSTDLGSTWVDYGRAGGFWDEVPIEMPLENKVTIAKQIFQLPAHSAGFSATFTFTH
ncbi:MAG TPA: hypothetical protein VFW34_03885 [Candidatus Rubrimentiphilum sp.]|nr:hypothetical protein [Candidatus Rubrimentiphilum sp.]